MTIQVTNLPFDITDAQLADLKAKFSSFGKIETFEVMTVETVKIIIVQLDSGEEAAIEDLDGIKWPERKPKHKERMMGEGPKNKEGGDGPRLKVKKQEEVKK